jgi:hypothetical protein
MADLFVRVESPDYSLWLNAFVSAENGLVEAGINQWTVYQDTWNGNIVLVHFIADDIDRAMAFFGSDEFKEINARSGATGRSFYLGTQQGGAKPAARKPAAKKPAAKPAAKTATAKKTTAKPAATTSTEATPAKKPSSRTTKKTT